MRPLRLTAAAIVVAVACLGAVAAVSQPATSKSVGEVAGPAPRLASAPRPVTAPSVSTTATSPTASARVSAPSVKRLRKGQVIVKLTGEATPSALKRVAKSAGTSVGAVSVLHGNTVLWRVPPGVSEAEFGRRLEESSEIAYAEPDYNRQLAVVYTPPAYTAPNEAAYTELGPSARFPYWRSWWLRDIKATQMWEQAYTGPAVQGKYPLRASGRDFKVAVLDTGLWPDHPDADNIVPGWDFFDKDADVTPPDPDLLLGYSQADQVKAASHGTNVAGLIAATVGNGIGSFGSGYDTQVRVYKIAGVDADGDLVLPDSVIISAIQRAVDDGCKIINMSFAGVDDSLAMRDAINAAHARGCILVAAGGNETPASPALRYPAGWPNVVGIGALTKTDSGASVERASFSNYGKGLDLTAPGDLIWGLTRPGYGESASGYDWWSGTSMASPIVAGGLTVLWRAVPDMTGDEIVSVAQSSATDLYTKGWDQSSGWGELNLLAAYQKLKTTYPLLTAPTISVPTTPSVKAIPITWSKVPGYHVRYDVRLDGSLVGVGIAATGTVLPAVTPGTHTISVTPRSLRNWADSTAVGSRSVSAFQSLPVMTELSWNGTKLLWKSTETVAMGGRYLFALDGGSAVTTSAESYDASALPLGMHSATVRAVDPNGLRSEPLGIVFRRWPQPSVTRVSGSDRYKTNAALATSTFATAKTVVLVGGENWPDGLSAGPLASSLGGPVLVTKRDSLPTSTRSALSRLRVTTVVVVGGSASVSDGVVKTLRASGFSVRRVWGRDRYATANAVAREVWRRRGGGPISNATALVASGAKHQDALVASTLGARKGWPVLLTPSSSLPSGLLTTMRAIGATRTVVVGSSSAVSSATLAKLPAATRIAGADAPATSVAVAKWAIARYPSDFRGERYWVASSSSAAFSDSLGVGAAAGRTSGLLLLTPKTLAPSVSAYYSANKADAAVTTVVGGPVTLPTSLLTAIKRLVGAP